jgi:hypothetical protein
MKIHVAMRKRLRLVVLGILGRDPVAGVAWQALHFVEGLRRLGHDVVYVEDTGDWAFDAEDGCRHTVGHVAHAMDWCGLSDRWAYRAAALGDRVFGMSEAQLAAALERADAIVNVTASTRLREEHLLAPVRIYVETDPGLPQIAIAQGKHSVREFLAAHTHHFTYGENLGAPDCAVPQVPFNLRPTRQPVVLDWWWAGSDLETGESRDAHPRFTTVATWRESAKDVRWGGRTYTWSKHEPFLRFLQLPRSVATRLELALACGDATVIQRLRSYGWDVVDAQTVSADLLIYRDYIRGSRGEFTVAKDQYTQLSTGWFSDRSACYLAAGRPVVTQETGFSKFLPTGRGLFAFETLEDVATALAAIESDYSLHRRAAREIATEYFAAERVLGDLLRRADL